MARVCASCGKEISSGSAYHEVNTPDGARAVHQRCLGGAPGLVTLDGDQGELVPRARKKAPPRPEELPALYASGAIRRARAQAPPSRQHSGVYDEPRPASLELFPTYRR